MLGLFRLTSAVEHLPSSPDLASDLNRRPGFPSGYPRLPSLAEYSFYYKINKIVSIIRDGRNLLYEFFTVTYLSIFKNWFVNQKFKINEGVYLNLFKL